MPLPTLVRCARLVAVVAAVAFATAGAPDLASAQAASTTVPASVEATGQRPSQAPTGDPLQDTIDRVQRWLDPDRDGFYPWAGSVMPGGWLTLGGGYRASLGRGVRMDAYGGWSLRNYKLVDATIAVPLSSDNRLRLDLRSRLVDAPRVQFFGLGNDTVREDFATFDFEPKSVAAQLHFAPVEGLELGAGLGLLHVGSGPGSARPSIETVFPPGQVPGLGQASSFVTLGAHVQADTRDSLEFTRSGGWYRASWQRYADRRDEGFSHQQIDVEVRRFVPVGGPQHAVAIRGVYSATPSATDNAPPHYLLPLLGDGENLRGFANQRFADRHLLLLQSEYRYRLTEQLHAAGFVDLGRVGARIGDLSPGGFHPGFGVGLRAQFADAFGVRADVARSAEQWAFIVSSIIF
jgi:hypothetical protein